MKRRLLLLAGAALLSQAPAADAPVGYYGVAIDVKTDGGMPWNPKLKSVTISRVAANSPASKQGVAAGDQVLAADGLSIAGRKARELEPVLHKKVGESLRLSLKRPDGRAYEVTLVAIAKPAPAPAPAAR